MVTVSISELKARLSEHIRLVEAGEQVVVTDRGRAVALLGPAPKAVAEDERLQRLADTGIVKLGCPVSDRFFDLPAGKDVEGAVRSALLDEREEGQ